MIVDTPYDYLEVGVYREMETLAFEISHDRDVMDGDGGVLMNDLRPMDQYNDNLLMIEKYERLLTEVRVLIVSTCESMRMFPCTDIEEHIHTNNILKLCICEKRLYEYSINNLVEQNKLLLAMFEYNKRFD